MAHGAPPYLNAGPIAAARRFGSEPLLAAPRRRCSLNVQLLVIIDKSTVHGVPAVVWRSARVQAFGRMSRRRGKVRVR